MCDCLEQLVTCSFYTELAKITEQFKRLCGEEVTVSKAAFCNLLKELGWPDGVAERYYRYKVNILFPV